MDVGNRMKKLRESRNLSQSQLAKLLGVSRAAISHYERNIRQPRIEFFLKMAQVIGVDVEDIVGNNDSEGPTIENLQELRNKNISLVLDGQEITNHELNRMIQFIRMERSIYQRIQVVEEMYRRVVCN